MSRGTTGSRRVCYDALLQVDPSPVVALNRVVAVARVDGPEAALVAIAPLLAEPALTGYYLLYAIHADSLARSGRRDEATARFDKAVELAPNAPTRRFLAAKRDDDGSGLAREPADES